MTAAPREIVVVGAGVIGLSTAVCLAERGQRVEVRARLAPTQTTSAVASAMVGPAMVPPDSDADRRERASIAEFTALAEIAGTRALAPLTGNRTAGAWSVTGISQELHRATGHDTVTG